MHAWISIHEYLQIFFKRVINGQWPRVLSNRRIASSLYPFSFLVWINSTYDSNTTRKTKIIINAPSVNNRISCIAPKLVNIEVPANIFMDSVITLKIAKMWIIFGSETGAKWPDDKKNSSVWPIEVYKFQSTLWGALPN